MKMKTLAVFLAVMATSLLRAADFKSGDLYYNITSGSEPYSVEVTYQSTTSDNYQGVTAVTIPNSVSYNGIDYVITGIGERAFYGCSSLESIEIPVGVTLIGDQALSECSALTAITWNAKNCGQIWVNLTPPSPLPGMVGNPVLEDAFDGIREQITSFTLGDGVERIPDHLCREMSSLKSITLPKNLKTIGTAAFLDCSSLASIIIPRGVTDIGASAFSGCSSLTSITIPENVASMGDRVFYYCPSLTSIVWNAKRCNDFFENMAMDAEDCLPFEPEYITSFVFGNSVEHIPACICRKMENLASIIIPESVVSIGDDAFSHCDLLISISIPDNVDSIGDRAFWYCESLSSVVIGNGVKSIGYRTFEGCEALSTVAFGSALVSIGEYAFAYCPSITSLTIPENVTAIGDLAFYRCTSLGTVILNEGLTSIGNRVFAYCPDLTDVYCSAEEVPTTGSYVFDYPENATLHVPAIALEAYKTTAPWRYFGTIVAIEGEQPAEDWSEWTTLGTAVTASGKDAMMTNLRHWGEGTIEEWEEPITIDQRTNKADPSKQQLRLSGIFNAKDIILDYDSSTATITADQQSTGYATNTAMIEEQGVPDPYKEFLFSINSGSYRPATGVIDLSNAFFYISDMYGFEMGFTLQIEGVTPPTFTATWNRRYVGREGGEATLTVSFEAPIVKYRKFVLAPGENVSVSAVKALYAANPETDLAYEETDQPTTTITCTEMGTYRVVLIPIGTDGTAVLDYGIISLASYAEPDYGTYEWDYLGESTVTEHVGSLLIPNGEIWEEVDGAWVNKYPWQSTITGVQTYRRADNPNIIGLRNLYGESHPYSSMFTYIDQAQDWWVYIDITDPKDVKLLTTPVGVSSSQMGYGCFINQYANSEAATYADGVITFPNGSVLLGNFPNQDPLAAFDMKIVLPAGSAVTGIPLNNEQSTIYDLSGRKVTDTENLKGGIYIVNGRKVLISD